MATFTDYCREAALKREEVALFLDPKTPNWARFDPEVGYVLGNYMPRDGIGGSLTISTAQPSGQRTSVVYADRPCRINTYGNSFTQCHQVSDQETWQEYLAGHLGEPVRNFGMGGHGAYQAYRVMKRTESGPEAARYAILYIWGDDHHRSLLRCRHVLTHRWWNHVEGRMFHGNPWAHLEMDLSTGRLGEHPSLLPTPASLAKLADPDWLVEAMKGDWMLMMSAFANKEIEDVDLAAVNRIAEIVGAPQVTAPARDLDARRAQVGVVRHAYAFAATRWVVEKALEFTRAAGKELLVVFFCPNSMRQLLSGQPRWDQAILDWAKERKVRHFDMAPVHLADYAAYKIPVGDYMKRFFIGHYSPAGNHFFAYAIKDVLVDWLDPRPVTYRADDQARIGFQAYLPE